MNDQTKTHAVAAACSLALIASCGTDYRPAVESVDPLNGSTAIPLGVQPKLTLAEGATARLVVGDGAFLLRDLTDNKVVGGSILIEGRSLTYQPKRALSVDHRFELTLKKDAIAGEKLLATDGSEWPEQTFRWPYRLRFSTASAPRVRAVYLEDPQRRPRLYIRFSQAMDPVVSADQFSLSNDLKQVLKLAAPVWIDQRSARLDIDASQLDPAGLYRLKIGRQAQAKDGTSLDGDGDGKGGEPDDSVIVEFTGSEPVVCSRFETEC